MKLPLFVASPVIPSDSTYALLAAGEWVVETDIKDSVLNLSVSSDGVPALYEAIQTGQKIVIPSLSPVRASIVSAGKERNISLYLNDNLP